MPDSNDVEYRVVDFARAYMIEVGANDAVRVTTRRQVIDQLRGDIARAGLVQIGEFDEHAMNMPGPIFSRTGDLLGMAECAIITARGMSPLRLRG